MSLVEQMLLLVELGHQIEVPDDLTAGLVHHVRDGGKVRLGVGVPVAAEVFLHRRALNVRRVVHAAQLTVRLDVVHRADDIVIGVGGFL